MSNIGLNIAVSGLDAQQVAMDTVAQNLANANTPGYVAESANIVPVIGGDPLGVGDGVHVTGITQSSAGLLMTNNQQAQGALSQGSSLQQVLTEAQISFPEPSSSGFGAQLANFWQSWDAIAQNPSSLAARTQVINQAQNLVTSLQQMSDQLTQLQNNAQSQLTTTIGQANTLLSQVAQLNQQILNVKGTGASADSLIDQRNQIENQLATSIGAVSRPGQGGADIVSVGGIALVQGDTAATLKVTGAAGNLQIVDQQNNVAISASNGTAAGLMAGINQYLPSYQSQLDSIATSLASTVNGQLAAGYTASGASGAGYPLFTGTSAGTLALNAAVVGNPQLLAASSTGTMPDASNDGGNAQAMANLYNVSGGPDQLYQTLVQNVGSQVQSINTQVQAQTSVANAAQQNLQAVAGVNNDQEMVAMLGFQQSYQASAKVISTIDTMVQSLLSSV